MARIRSIKPEFWDDRKLARRASRDARLLYIALWNLADEHGRLNGDPQWIKGQAFSYDDDLDAMAVDTLLEELANPALGAVVRYEADGDPYLFLPKLAKHQRLEPDKVKSRLPEPPGTQQKPPDPDPPQSRADESESRADKSAPRADESSLLYVAGSREHVAGGRGSRARAEPPRTVLANGLLEEHARQVSPPLPRDVRRSTGQQIDLLLDDPAIGEDEIREALARLRRRPDLGPKVLPSLVNQVRQERAHPELAARASPAGRRQQQTDELFGRAMERARNRSAKEASGDPRGNGDASPVHPRALPAAGD